MGPTFSRRAFHPWTCRKYWTNRSIWTPDVRYGNLSAFYSSKCFRRLISSSLVYLAVGWVGQGAKEKPLQTYHWEGISYVPLGGAPLIPRYAPWYLISKTKVQHFNEQCPVLSGFRMEMDGDADHYVKGGDFRWNHWKLGNLFGNRENWESKTCQRVRNSKQTEATFFCVCKAVKFWWSKIRDASNPVLPMFLLVVMHVYKLDR